MYAITCALCGWHASRRDASMSRERERSTDTSTQAISYIENTFPVSCILGVLVRVVCSGNARLSLVAAESSHASMRRAVCPIVRKKLNFAQVVCGLGLESGSYLGWYSYLLTQTFPIV